MANHEACEVYIDQQIQEGLQEGKTPYSIGKELAGWLEKLFEAKVKPDTIKKRAERERKKIGTNVPKKSKPQQSPPVTPKHQNPNGHNRLTDAGGARPGAGRPKKNKANKTATKPDHPTAEEKPKPAAYGRHWAVVAISQLERIAADDPERTEGFDMVVRWINTRRKK